ncbi:MAG: TerB family tellurite resistance protein, partial [Xanthomonadales bacterium]|nr:TerB family tellurite resistance protein [Xanthomonadales bacterium]
MNTAEQRAVLNIMVHAALADGRKSDVERTAVRDAAESLAGEGGAALAGVYQDVLLKRVTVAAAAAALPSIEHRQLAYEMAVCVCDADGVQDAPEQAFLAELRRTLGLEGDATAAAAAAQADAIAEAAYIPAPPPAAAGAATAATVATAAAATVATATKA